MVRGMSKEFTFGALVPSDEPSGAVSVDVTVPHDLRYFEGHFPGDPIVPGVAQLTAIAEAQARRAFPALGPSAGVKRLKFMEALRPGDTLRLELTPKPGKVAFKLHRWLRVKETDSFALGAECSRGTLLFR